MNNRMIVFSSQPYEISLPLIEIKEVENSLGLFTGQIFVLVKEKSRKNIECAVESLKTDIPIVDFADYNPESTDRQYVLADIFTFLALKKITNVFVGMREAVGQFNGGGVTVPAF